MNKNILKKLEHCHGKTVQTTEKNESGTHIIFSDGSVLMFPDVMLSEEPEHEREEQFITKDHHIVEDADGERFVKNNSTTRKTNNN